MTAQTIAPVNGQQQVQQPQQTQPSPAVQTKPMEVVPKIAPVEIVSESTKAISEDAMKKRMEDLNRLLSIKGTNVSLEYDNLASPQKVSIIDTESGKLIRQIPATAVIEIAEKAKDYILGLMVDKKI